MSCGGHLTVLLMPTCKYTRGTALPLMHRRASTYVTLTLVNRFDSPARSYRLAILSTALAIAVSHCGLMQASNTGLVGARSGQVRNNSRLHCSCLVGVPVSKYEWDSFWEPPTWLHTTPTTPWTALVAGKVVAPELLEAVG